MNEVANQLSRQNLVTEELALREDIVAGLRKNVGAEHESTLNAEWKLAVCLTSLDRPEEADLLLRHVVAERILALGEDDPQTLLAKAWRASVSKRLGRIHDARILQEEVVAGYQHRGEEASDQALLATLNLSSTMTDLGEFDESARLLHQVLDVRSTARGPEDVKTLEVLHSLIVVSMMAKDYAQADSMARRLLKIRIGVSGSDASETDTARQLLTAVQAAAEQGGAASPRAEPWS
jgi:hypothetical protein